MQFEAGKTYSTRSVCDRNCVFSITVTKRTAKTIATTDGKTFRIAVNDRGEETIKPMGSYSMAPIISARA